MEPDKNFIKVIGVGGGGNNAVNHMFRQRIPYATFVNINWNSSELKESTVPTLKIGNDLGGGKYHDTGRRFAEDAAEEIGKLFDDDTRIAFVIAGMGGRTGTGVAPVVARIAKERGLLTIGIVTKPYPFEGQKRIERANGGVIEMVKYVDSLLVLNNEHNIQLYGDLDFLNAFTKCDKTLADTVHSFSELISNYGPINIDFYDLSRALCDRGHIVLSTGYGEGKARVTSAIQDALNSPLLNGYDILNSKNLVFCLFCNPNAEKELLMSDSTEITDFLTTLNKEVDVVWGIAHEENLENKVRVTILASVF